MEDKNKNDDFFSQIEKDQKIEDPFADDEILFRDENGTLKTLKAGEVSDTTKTVPAKAVDVVSLAPVKSLVMAVKPLNLDKEVDAIIQKSEVDLFNDSQVEKFKGIVTSYLKGVRDRVATREMLGEIGFDSQKVDQIFVAINEQAENLDSELRQKVGDESFSNLQVEAQKILEEPIEEPIEEPPVMVFESGSKPAIDKSELLKSPAPSSTKVASPLPKPKDAAPVRPRVEDVRFQPRLIGPIEEIRTMTLTDFRRLAPTPEQAIEKVIEKINILEEESFTKKTQAVTAWKENEVNRLYLQLGDQSMEEKKSISEIIAARQQEGQPTLTEKELEAVIELNQKLRY